MCGRFVARQTSREMLDTVSAHLDVDPALGEDLRGWEPSSNVAPTTLIRAAVRPVPTGPVRLMALRWGLVTPWAARQGSVRPLINARAETVGEKPSFREAFLRRRCLVVMDGYYEWTSLNGAGSKRTGSRESGRRQPHYLSAQTGEMLGVGAIWNPPMADHPASVALITTAASDDIAAVHDRMPLLLSPEDWSVWMDPTPTALAAVSGLLRPAPAGTLQYWAVDPAVNSARATGAGLTAPVGRTSDDLGASGTPQLFPDGLGS